MCFYRYITSLNNKINFLFKKIMININREKDYIPLKQPKEDLLYPCDISMNTKEFFHYCSLIIVEPLMWSKKIKDYETRPWMNQSHKFTYNKTSSYKISSRIRSRHPRTVSRECY